MKAMNFLPNFVDTCDSIMVLRQKSVIARTFTDCSIALYRSESFALRVFIYEVIGWVTTLNIPLYKRKECCF